MTDQSPLPYPPPFQDLATLARHICMGERTIEEHVQQGIFPKHTKMQGGKRLWSWKVVTAHLEGDDEKGPQSPGQQPGGMADAIRRDVLSRRGRRAA